MAMVEFAPDYQYGDPSSANDEDRCPSRTRSDRNEPGKINCKHTRFASPASPRSAASGRTATESAESASPAKAAASPTPAKPTAAPAAPSRPPAQ